MASKDHGRLDELQRDPYPLYAEARGTPGLTFVPELDAWLVARDADVREVLIRSDDFSSVRALLPDVMPSPAALQVLSKGFGKRPTVVSTDGASHQRHRAPSTAGSPRPASRPSCRTPPSAPRRSWTTSPPTAAWS